MILMIGPQCDHVRIQCDNEAVMHKVNFSGLIYGVLLHITMLHGRKLLQQLAWYEITGAFSDSERSLRGEADIHTSSWLAAV